MPITCSSRKRSSSTRPSTLLLMAKLNGKTLGRYSPDSLHLTLRSAQSDRFLVQIVACSPVPQLFEVTHSPDRPHSLNPNRATKLEVSHTVAIPPSTALFHAFSSLHAFTPSLLQKAVDLLPRRLCACWSSPIHHHRSSTSHSLRPSPQIETTMPSSTQ